MPVTAVITGASTGIGRAIAIELAGAGYTLALVGRRAKALEETARLSKANQVSVVLADLSSSEQAARACEQVRQQGTVGVLINAAGVWHDDQGKLQGPLAPETPMSQVESVIGVGLLGAFRMTRGLAPMMMKEKRGKIIQIGCGFAGAQEARGWLHYYVVNKALDAFTAGLAAELRPYDIQVNCIAPWYVATDAVQRFYPDDAPTALEPKRVAELAKFLLSDAAGNISGQTIELRSALDVG
jgi:3-oxoacyl-[acyl-carrier protein] reductase